MHIYLDESGDLGFGKGSTKYFTIVFAVVKDPLSLKRCIKMIKIKYGISKNEELKGARTQKLIKEDLLRELAKLDIEIHAITVNKENVYMKLRSDPNKLYNYMAGLILIERVLQEPKNESINIQVDKRITSVTSGFKLDDYLIHEIWYKSQRHDLDLNIHHLESHHSYSIQGIDVICNSIFRKYNLQDSTLFNIIRGKIKSDRKLFFNK